MVQPPEHFGTVRARLKNGVEDARILIADPVEENVALLRRVLRVAGYKCVRTTADPSRLPSLQASFDPDIILADLRSFGFLSAAQAVSAGTLDADPALLLMLSGSSRDMVKEAASLGALDVLVKPLDPVEVAFRIRNVLEARCWRLQRQAQNEVLEERVRERTCELEEAQIEVLERLALAAEFRDDITGQHTRRVGQIAALVARNLGFSGTQVGLIRRAAPLHDVGKIGIPDEILLKPGRLTHNEFDVMKSHTTLGARLLSGSRFPLLEHAEEIAMTHHERWDGEGYPLGLEAGSIPIAGRIVAVADVFDALTHERPYKHAWNRDEALGEIAAQSCRQFDPAVVQAFMVVVESGEFKVPL